LRKIRLEELYQELEAKKQFCGVSCHYQPTALQLSLFMQEQIICSVYLDLSLKK
jgi:hypothetical protein